MSSLWNYFVGYASLSGLILLVFENSDWAAKNYAWFAFTGRCLIGLALVDAAARLLACTDRRAHLRNYWPDSIVFAPVVAYIIFQEDCYCVTVLARQAALLRIMLTRFREAHKPLPLWTLHPAQTVVFGFLMLITAGTTILMLPEACATGQKTAGVDALFTATSAVCVTGLTVVDTAQYFSRFGQTVLLALIQLGGFGIMTAAVGLVVMLRKEINVRQQVALQDALDHDSLAGARQLMRFIVAMTLTLEAAGTVLLWVTWGRQLGWSATTAYHALFHSVSAFCNAGFSTFAASLAAFRNDLATNIIICILIILGGLGFMSVRDIVENLKPSSAARTHQPVRLRVHTKLVLTVSLVLIAAGALILYAMEREASFAGWDFKTKILASLFQSISARTAGFNTCDIGRLAPASLFVLTVLMFIGASPGGTGGGIKTTTVAVLWAVVVSRLRGRENVELCKRTLPVETILKAVSLLFISLCLVIVFGAALMYTENHSPLALLFETVSAFGTVGLSVGITPHMTTAGKLLITILMLVGRLGPLTLAYAVILRRTPAKYVLAEERVMIG